MKRIYKSNTGQTIFDVALMSYGSLEGLVYLLEDNPDLIQSDGTIKQFGAEYLVRNEALNKRMKDRMFDIVPTTGQDKNERVNVIIRDSTGAVLTDSQGNVLGANLLKK